MEEATLNANATAPQQQQDHVSRDHRQLLIREKKKKNKEYNQLEEFMSTIQYKLNMVTEQSKFAEETPAIIPQVPVNPGEQQDFEPRIISIGPHYWGHPRLRSMGNQKLRHVDAILKRNGARPLKDYIESLMKLQDRVRTCYTGTFVRLSTDLEFVEMMLLDGCFIIKYFHPTSSRGADEVINNKYVRQIIEHDMLLLQNQLPFFVIQSIFDLAMDQDPLSLSEAIRKFFNRSSFIQETPFVNEEAIIPSKNIQHLLHFFHWFLDSALNRYRSEWVPEHGERKKYALSIPSATVLARAGVKFKKRKKCFSLLHVHFHEGNMRIPPLVIDSFSKSLIKNLLAFEKFNPNIEPQFSAYVKFLDHIINTSEDVALLHKECIINHALGSDEEVANLFNSIGRSTLHNQPDHDHMKWIYGEVDTYCRRCQAKWHKRWAILMSKYFDTPWSVLKFVAAFVVLVLAFLQTFMAFYSYFHPYT